MSRAMIYLLILSAMATAEINTCVEETTVAGRRLKHSDVSFLARGSLRDPRIPALPSEEQYRVLRQALRLRFSKAEAQRARSRRSSADPRRWKYDRFFDQISDLKLDPDVSMALVRDAFSHPHFSATRAAIAQFKFTAETVLRAFETTITLDGIEKLSEIGLWDTLDFNQRRELLEKSLKVAGWRHFAAHVPWQPESGGSLFAVALGTLAARHFAPNSKDVVHFLHLPGLSDDQVVAAYSAVFDLNRTKLSSVVAADLGSRTLRPDLKQRLVNEILVKGHGLLILETLKTSGPLADDIVLKAQRRVLADLPYQAKTLLEIGPRLILSPEGRFDYLRALGPRLSVGIIEPAVLTAYQIDDERFFRLALTLPESSREDLDQITSQRKGEWATRLRLAVNAQRELRPEPEDVVVPVGELKARLAAYPVRYPLTISPIEATLPWDLVQREASGFGILRRILHRMKPDPRYQSSRDVISDLVLGEIDPDFVRELGKASSDRLGLLYEASLNIDRRGSRASLFGQVEVAPDLRRVKNLGVLTDLIVALRDFEMVHGHLLPGESIDRASVKFGPQINEANVTQFTEFLLDGVRSALGVRLMDLGRLHVLNDLWGNLRPIFTLSARYLGTPEWKVEIPTLQRIFAAEMAGDFKAYKYEGLASEVRDRQLAMAQLAVLKTTEVRDAWKKNRSIGSLATEGSRDDIDLRRTTALEIIRNNLRLHLGPEVKRGSSRRTEILNEINGGEITDLSTLAFSPQSVLNACLLRLLDHPKDDEILRLTSFTLRFATQLPFTSQVYEDVRSIRKAYVKAKDAVGPQIIVSTTFDDAKTLLTIGNLVNTSSCQNYQTGSHAHTLPSYVIDANIKGLAAFGLGPRDFRESTEFWDVANALKIALVDDIEFDGYSRRFRFHLRDKTITSWPLRHAHRRHILRLGRAGSLPALLVEKAYLQSHPFALEMERQVQALVESIRDAIGATTVPSYISFVQSRNPLGTYTDRGGGRKLKDWSI